MIDIINRFYRGKNSSTYEQKRVNNPKWSFEEQSLQQVLESAGENIPSVLDASAGTGRFLGIYRNKLKNRLVHTLYLIAEYARGENILPVSMQAAHG